MTHDNITVHNTSCIRVPTSTRSGLASRLPIDIPQCQCCLEDGVLAAASQDGLALDAASALVFSIIKAGKPQSLLVSPFFRVFPEIFEFFYLDDLAAFVLVVADFYLGNFYSTLNKFRQMTIDNI